MGTSDGSSTLLEWAVSHPRDADAERSAREALETFGDAPADAVHLPFVDIGVDVPVESIEDAAAVDAGPALDLDTIEVALATPDKVHLAVDVDGGGTCFFAVTRADGRWGVQLRSGGDRRLVGAERDRAVEASREPILGFLADFNAADVDATKRHQHFPHCFLLRDGVMMTTDSDRFDFAAMKRQQGWHFTGFEYLGPSLVTETRVHWELAFSRFHPDGTRYLTVPALWATTRVSGRWALQYRSLVLPPDF